MEPMPGRLPDTSGYGQEGEMDMEAKREQLIDFLTECFARDIIDTDEYERRVAAIQSANSYGELEPIVQDLRDPGASFTRVARPDRKELNRNELNRNELDLTRGKKPQRILSILSNQQLAGDWLNRDSVLVQALLASVTCDLRDSRLFSITRIQIYCLMAKLKIYIPRGIALESNVAPILAEICQKERSPAQMPGAPIIQMSGVLIMSELHIEN